MEKDKSKERSEKAEKILELTLNLANKTSDYINQTSQERRQDSASFAREIHKILNNGDNSDIIDAHYNGVSRFIYTHLCDFGLFRTDTRKKFNDFDVACSKLRIG